MPVTTAIPCPKCKAPIEVMPGHDERGNTWFSETYRCYACGCSIGVSMHDDPHIVYDPEEHPGYYQWV